MAQMHHRLTSDPRSPRSDRPRRRRALSLAIPTLRSLAVACFLAVTGAGFVSVVHSASPEKARFRLALCTEAPIRLQGPPGAEQSRGCVATFTQELSDPATIHQLGAKQVRRRYLVYAPRACRPRPSRSCSCSPATPPAPRRPRSTTRTDRSSAWPIATASSSSTATASRTRRRRARNRPCPRAASCRAASPRTRAKASTSATSAASSSARDGAPHRSLAHLRHRPVRRRRHGVRARPRGP